ncbi:regulatory protein [Alkalibacterium subtropicum]|uniref:Regulatory protein RecX n=1 Tax=Alkalibacterium subtropicum TaxID=753702 RepID=A0A1I1LHS7_9LACT|nr:recombination regulator RecX [Alkalibacterium subtropicum]SFC72571.1 regulatory protein [Alkalibacterium subtropicum]
MNRETGSENNESSLPNLIELGPSIKEKKPGDKKNITLEDVKNLKKDQSEEPAAEFVITKVQAQKAKNRFNIYINDSYAFAVDDSILVKYRLIKGKELDQEMIEELKKKGEMSKAYQAALHYLNFKMRTEKEIREYLAKKDYSEIDAVIERLREHRLIDDKEYAKSFVRTNYQLKTEGPKKIERSLYAKGLSPDEIAYGLEEYSDDDQLENAKKLTEKTLKRQRNKSNREIEQKIREQLMTKGFDRDIIAQVLDEMSLEQPEEDEYEALVKQGEKAYKRYARKEDKYGARRKTKTFLYSKGYPFDLIEQFLSEKEGEY